MERIEMTDLPRTRLRGPVVDTGDAVSSATFYSNLLGWRIKDQYQGDHGSWAVIESPSGELKMEFQGLDDYKPPTWPNTAGEQQMMMHLDIAVEVLGSEDDPRPRFRAAVDHAVSLGATVAEHQPRPDQITVMIDPAGHPFCLCPAPIR